jgi:hypothetical protein
MFLWSVIRYLVVIIFYIGTKMLVQDNLDSDWWFLAGWCLGIVAAILNTIMVVLQGVLIQE